MRSSGLLTGGLIRAIGGDSDGTVTAGDSTVVEASPGTTVRVVWTSGDGSMVLSRATMK